MERARIVLGYCPTRRDVFDVNAAIAYGRRIREFIKQFDIEVVDIDGINDENLLFGDRDVAPVIERFRAGKIDALFFPHCNFGSENRVAQVARALQVPVLLWGPRDDAPNAETGMRSRDTQCGLFATGKMLRRHNVKFTYLTNTPLESDYFKEKFQKFLAVVSVVKALKNLNILQISTRPEPFGTVMCNEGELLESYNVHVYPVAIPDVTFAMDRLLEEKGSELLETASYVKANISPNAKREDILKISALKLAMKQLAAKYNCRAIAIQCWTALQDVTRIVPCLANALLTDEGIPVVCETDIHGAITAVMTQAATMNEHSQFFADLTVRHPEEENAELLWHCGNFPYSMAKDKEKAYAGTYWINPSDKYGTCMWQIRNGDVTVARFDGDHGEYSLFIGEAEAVDGPYNGGCYTWIKTGDWPRWEHKLVCGPYIHHVSGVYGRFGDVLCEACKYIGIKADPADCSEEELAARWIR